MNEYIFNTNVHSNSIYIWFFVIILLLIFFIFSYPSLLYFTNSHLETSLAQY